MKKNTGFGKIRNRVAVMSGIMLMSLAAPFASSMTCFAEGTDKNTMGGWNTKTTATVVDGSSGLVKDIIKGKDSVGNLIKAAEIAVTGLSESFPVIKVIASPFMQMANALYKSEHPEATLDSISAKMTELNAQIDKSKKDMIEAMNSANDISDFLKVYNDFDASYREMSKQVSQIAGFKTTSREDKDEQITDLIGYRKSWVNNESVVYNYFTLGEYLAGHRKLSSGNRTIYETMLNHFGKYTAFEKEAMEKTEPFIADAVSLYIESSTKMFYCLLAERSVLLRQGTEKAKSDAEYCEDKIADILQQIIDVHAAVKEYESNLKPFTFYDRSGNGLVKVGLSDKVGIARFSEKKELSGLSGKLLTKKQMEYLINYVKTNYPGRNMEWFLRKIGFLNNDAHIIYMENQMADLKKKVSGADLQVMKKVFWTFGENFSPDEAYLLTDAGYMDPLSTQFGFVRRYYYYGVKLDDSRFAEKANKYLLVSSSFTTEKKNEAEAGMIYLMKK